MAIHTELELTNRIKKLEDQWDGKQGKEVEDFISRRLKNPIGPVIKYDKSTLTIYNPEGEAIAEGNVTVVPPNYTTELSLSQILVNESVKESNVEVNYSAETKFKVGFNIKTFYESTGNFYDLSSKVSITFYIEGTTDQVIIDDISPNKRDDNSLQYRDITSLFQKNMQGAVLKATVTANGKTSTVSYDGTITIHKIEISTSSTHVADRTVVFNIQGLRSTTDMELEYYDVPLGTDSLESIKSKSIPITSNTHAELTLSIGGHQLLARVCNSDRTFYSNWIQANVVSHDEKSKTEMLAIIGGIPSEINNCENAKLFQIINVPGLGGSVEIVSYLADDPGVFYDDQSTWPEFNRISLSTDLNDSPSVSDYYSYIELEDVSNSTKAVAFSLVINGQNYNLYSLEVVNGYLSGRNVFTIIINENPYNVDGAFNYVPGAIEDFSQIKGQATTLFNDINENIESSDGWIIDEDLIAYKISGQNRNLFNKPKDLGSLLSSDRGFTIEVMLKNYNCNGEDPVMNIGSLLFGPGYSRLESSNADKVVDSRADFEKDEITHLMFVFDPAYKPSTYNNIYDQLFNENGVTFTSINDPYPILKVFINGTINREIEVKKSDLSNDDGFKLQIFPSSSDLNLYIFRTYNWAFTNQQIQKNYISSRKTSSEKKEIYDRNDVLGSDGRVSFYKTMQHNNVMVVVIPETDKPLYYGNRETNGEGIDPNDPTAKAAAQATLLVHYKDSKYATSNGRFTGGKYKAQGSSAKKYMIHNVQYSKGNFISEADIKEGKTATSSEYVLPSDTEQIAAKKFVGKVNYASSMQSHKLGSIKLFDKAYKQSAFPSTYTEKLYTGGKKACYEESFVYFYYNLKPGQDINTITIDDLYTTEVINGIIVPKDQDVKYFGFQTWGSGKGDDPTYGYGDDTLEYLLLEGADNGSAGANFKQPWAAFQTWTPEITYDGHKSDSTRIIQQTESVTKENHTAGLLIQDGTIKFDSNGTDPWDIEYGIDEFDEDNKLAYFTDEVKAKGSSLDHFVEFYNNCYLYDFTNLKPNPNSNKEKFELFNKYGLEDHRIYMTRNTVNLYDKNESNEDVQVGTAAAFDVFRWDSRINKWVPGGLHHNGTKWNSLNLKTVFNNLVTSDLYKEYSDNLEVMNTKMWKDNALTDPNLHVDQFVLPAFRDMFRANVEKYCDKEDIIYHQAFIRLINGTDNRAKNTYYRIVGKLYTNKATVNDVEVKLVKIKKDTDTVKGIKGKKGYVSEDIFYEVNIDGDSVTLADFSISKEGLTLEDLYWKKTEKGDYKIRMMQDDMDTIFATNNNGQQVIPSYLLEPAFNKDTEKLWNDHHNSFFYPFDVCYYREITQMVGKIINYLIGNSTSIKDKTTALYDYYFRVQLEYPEVLYNHHAEIYYEMPHYLFRDGSIKHFSTTLNGFANNNVINPLSLSHGRCIESEYQFMKERLLLLGSQSNSAHGLYGKEWALSSEGSGGNAGGTTFSGKVEYTDYLYPTFTYKRTNGDEYTKLFNLTNDQDIVVNYDKVFKYIDTPKIPTTVSELATPWKEYPIKLSVDTTIPSYITSAHKIKAIDVLQGLDVTHAIPNLPNAKYLNINGNTANYHVNTIDIVIKDYLPIIENLHITNTVFSDSLLDFRDCNRLNTINLQGSFGIDNIILPENNRLSNVYLPNNLKQISLGAVPNLSIFNIPDGTKFTSISLDCSNLNKNFDYINLLNNYIDFSNLTSFVLNKTPSEGLIITEDIANKFAEIQTNSKIQKLIQGKFIIKDCIETSNEDGSITYTWGNITDISYSTKKKLVQAFGAIDSKTNSVYFEFKDTDLGKPMIAPEIAIDVPHGGCTVYPFESLYFQVGNDVRITNGRLDIKYTINGELPNGSELDINTGKLIITENTNSSFKFNIYVTDVDGYQLDPITGLLYLGFKAPKVGDFAYSDGTFSTAFDANKHLIGMIYQVEESIPNSEWKVCILGTSTVHDYFGADFYYYNTSTKSWVENNTTSFEQQSIFKFLCDQNGKDANQTAPDANTYLGTNVTSYSFDTDGIDRTYVVPTSLVDSGWQYTQTFASVGIQRLNSYIDKNNSFKETMRQNNYYQNNEIQKLDTIDDIDTVCNLFNESILLNYPSANYSKLLNPIYLKALTYQPENLEGDFAKRNYAKGKWYIPSIAELELLIYYRILSTSGNNDINPKSYWDSTEYQNGNSIFSNYIASTKFDSFLGSDKIAAQAGIDNKNFTYGEVTSGYPYQTTYGWFSTYPSPPYNTTGYNSKCRRDIIRTVSLCCQVTITRK